MAEYETLVITVKLIDQASVGVKEIQQRLNQLGGAVNIPSVTADLQKVNDAVRQHIEHQRNLNSQISGVAEAVRIGYQRVVGIQLAIVGAIGTVTWATRKLEEFAKDTIDMAVQARSIGASGGVFYNITRGLQQIGYTSREAEREVTSFFENVTETLRAGSQAQARFLENAANPEFVFSLMKRWQGMADKGDFATPMIEAARVARATFDETLARTGSQTKAARAQADVLRDMGLTSKAGDIQKLINGGPEEEERFKRREAAARQWTEH